MSHVFSLENDVTRQKLECFILRQDQPLMEKNTAIFINV